MQYKSEDDLAELERLLYLEQLHKNVNMHADENAKTI